MVVGLIVICLVFYAQEPRFLSSRNLVTITQFAAPIGIISLGIVLVLLLGEIDLSVGSVSGFAAADPGRADGQPGAVDARLRMLGGTVDRRRPSACSTACCTSRSACRRFVFSLAGLLAFQGVLLFVLGDNGTINLPSDSWLRPVHPLQTSSPGGVVRRSSLLICALYLVSQLRRPGSARRPGSRRRGCRWSSRRRR